MTDYRLSADPSPKVEVTQGDGSNRPMRSGPIITKPAWPATAPSLSVQLAELKEENAILRSILHGVGASLCTLAGSIGHDTEAAEAKARIDADAKRRF